MRPARAIRPGKRRRHTRPLASSLLAALVVAVPPCLAQAPPPGPQDPSTGDAARLYAAACAPCHGRDGDGKARGVRLLRSPQPRDFTAATFKFRSTPAGSLPADEDLYRTISRGVPGTWMPAWESLLTSAQRWALVRYLKGYSRFFSEDEPDPPIEVPPEPGETSELKREGRFVYLVLECGKCHGSRGRGDGPAAKGLEDDWGRRIEPYDFTRGTYRNGSSPADLYRTLVTGLNGTPMPAFEREGVAFPGGKDAPLVASEAALDAESRRELAAYLASQPTAAELETLSGSEMDDLVRRRLWALVYYVRSLRRSSGPFDWLLRGNPELEGRGRP